MRELCAEIRRFVDQTMAEGIADQFRLVCHLHFFHDPAFVGAHGLDAYRELVGDLRRCFARDQHLEYLVFPVG